MANPTPIFKFFVDAQQHTSPEASVSGIKVKEIAKVPVTYQLYLEEDGNTPDRPIADGEAVNLAGNEKHFFAVPPATFGR